MYRKCLKNKKKENKKQGSRFGRIGRLLQIHDASGTELAVGDLIFYGGHKCRILYDVDTKKYRAFLTERPYIYSKYGDKFFDKYNPDYYYSAYELPVDDGARMEIRKINEN